ncbi:MAG: formate--tetrahydrofolate ligase [Holosporaceae bacterium]|jgi:formate--tetrahydrofolate ligase|nr:formate--tetrahydrofolate ligase [Holosporaceae bacterium]
MTVQNSGLKQIALVAEQLGVRDEYLEPYGRHKAKILPGIWSVIGNRPNGKLILVTAINPTSAGEGKTTTTIGLGDAMSHLGYRTCIGLREPSLGPCFGLKGGATGGGRAQVAPTEDINLHFTGDIHAVTSAHNLLAAVVDNHMHQGNDLRLDPKRILWRRVLDLNDRALRHIVVGLGGKADGVVRESGFDISVASELMAILCLHADPADLRRRIDHIIVGHSVDGAAITCGQLKVTGSLMALLKDAVKPNLVQTLGGTPALIHGGPFANIAHGCNSIMATKYALKLADYVVTEAGFGADLGAEKFLAIKCPLLGKYPDAVVIVATLRAIKLHACDGIGEAERLISGFANLQKHVENIRHYNLPLVVAVNAFPSDDPEEIELVRRLCREIDATAVTSTVWRDGAAGGIALAQAVLDVVATASAKFRPLYERSDSVFEKLRKLATVIYGASGVAYSPQAKSVLEKVDADQEVRFYPICMAKTQYSLSDDKNLLGRPENFRINLRDAKIMAGAEFITTYAGDIVTMPGLPKRPAAESIDLNGEEVTGLS